MAQTPKSSWVQPGLAIFVLHILQIPSSFLGLFFSACTSFRSRFPPSPSENPSAASHCLLGSGFSQILINHAVTREPNMKDTSDQVSLCVAVYLETALPLTTAWCAGFLCFASSWAAPWALIFCSCVTPSVTYSPK